MRKETVFSFVLAILIVSGAIWVADRSFKENSVIGETSNPEISQGNHKVIPKHKYAESESGEYISSQDSTASHGISKCIISGKTVYSNEGCPKGIQAKSVTLHDSGGIVSPPKENLVDLTAKRQAAEREHSVRTMQVQAQVKSNKAECEWLNQHINWLDSIARQPQSGQMQDWIRQERKAARDRQFDIRC
jgi:hypothetical protein